MSERKDDIKFHIIAPSSYYGDGTLKQCYKTLMYPGAFNSIAAIIEQAGKEQGLSFSTAFYDERVQKGDGYFKLIVEDQSAWFKAVILTAKTHEIPRATDISRQMIDLGIPPFIGGTAVTLADWETLTAFKRMGIRFGVGEGENIIKQIAHDLVNRDLKDGYYQQGFIDLRKSPLPRIPDKRELASSISGLLACNFSEGCPYNCEFCGARIARGTSIGPERSRNKGDVLTWIEKVSRAGIKIMDTGDNCRKSWLFRKTSFLDELGDLNEDLQKEVLEVFMFNQMDARPDVIKAIAAMARAGVKWPFHGFETTDKLVLASQGKTQNDPAFYRAIVETERANGMFSTSGYMIGFPQQTLESIKGENESFRDLVDIAYPFIATSLPRTKHYIDAVREGQITDWDLNNYDTMHSVRNNLEHMTQAELEAAYWQSYIDLYMNRPAEKGSLLAYAQKLVEHGIEKKGVPFNMMMDGLIHPNLPVVRRPVDGFRGPKFDKDDPAFASVKAFEVKREEWLLENCWVTSES